MKGIRIQTKLIFAFMLTTSIIFAVNYYLYVNMNRVIERVDSVYEGNTSLNELQSTLNRVQKDLTDYLNTGSSDAMEDYYRYSEEYLMLAKNLNTRIIDDEKMLLEKNIYNLSNSYLKCTNEAIENKRGRKIEKYKESYEEATLIYEFLDVNIYSLNNQRFLNNSQSYKDLAFALSNIELINLLVLALTSAISIILAIILTRGITSPLRELANKANQVAKGNLDVSFNMYNTQDEIGVVARAFNRMIESIRNYIEKLTKSMELERELKERELLMETHLKDAQLKYLQSQINPHFLFNTLNAGTQLALMEGADRTYDYVQRVSEFFRYTVKTKLDTVELKDELELIDNYIYILNVRFSGEIHFTKQVDEELLKVKIPAMTIQPIVENCVNHGIRGIDRKGEINLSVYEEKDTICVSISDNGVGMTKEQIDKILEGRPSLEKKTDSNGVGMGNVLNRLKLYYDCEDVLMISSEGLGLGTKFVLRIPKNGVSENV